jgi:hypothetical protein
MIKNYFLNPAEQFKTLTIFITPIIFLSKHCFVNLLRAALYKFILALNKDTLFHWQKVMGYMSIFSTFQTSQMSINSLTSKCSCSILFSANATRQFDIWETAIAPLLTSFTFR